MAKRILVVGSHGTVGLSLMARLHEQLSHVEVLEWASESWREQVQSVDLMVLCVPESAAYQLVTDAVSVRPDIRILDCSATFRTLAGWTYGLAELPGQAAQIAEAQFVANAGCFASGAILLAAPLSRRGWLDATAYSIMGIGGYSAGGRAYVENPPAAAAGDKLCALHGGHKHVPEIRRFGGIEPRLMLSMGTFARGMSVEMFVDLPQDWVLDAWEQDYAGTCVQVSRDGAGSIRVGYEGDDVILRAYAHSPNVSLLVASYDNLGKGAAGNAIQNIRLMLGV